MWPEAVQSWFRGRPQRLALAVWAKGKPPLRDGDAQKRDSAAVRRPCGFAVRVHAGIEINQRLGRDVVNTPIRSDDARSRVPDGAHDHSPLDGVVRARQSVKPGNPHLLDAAAGAASTGSGRTVKFRDGTVVPALGQGSAGLGKGKHPQAVEEGTHWPFARIR